VNPGLSRSKKEKSAQDQTRNTASLLLVGRMGGGGDHAKHLTNGWVSSLRREKDGATLDGIGGGRGRAASTIRG